MRSAGPGQFHCHRPPGAAGAQHDDALALNRGNLADRLHHALAVVVVAGQPAIADRHVIGRADRRDIRVHLVQEGDRRHLVRHRDAGPGKTQGANAADRGAHLGLVPDIAFPELPVQAMMREDRIEHAVNRILGDRMPDHTGHLFLGRQGKGGHG